jgi:uncharacterized protein YbaP (TraB family)
VARALAEQDEIEALEGAGGLEVEAVARGEGRVSRPNRVRSRVLQVRLNPEELAAVEAIAAARGLPASTVARERLLGMIAEDQASRGDVAAQLNAAIKELVGRVSSPVR